MIDNRNPGIYEDSKEISFILNEELYYNSLKHHTVIFKDTFFSHHQTSYHVLRDSARASLKDFKILRKRIIDKNPIAINYCISVQLGHDIISVAIAASEDEAKEIALDVAIELLQQEFYTLELKTWGCSISRNQLYDEKFSCLNENDTTGVAAEPIDCLYKKVDLLHLRSRVNILLKDFKSSSLEGLVIQNLSKEERKIVLQEAEECRMKRRLRRDGDLVHVVIERNTELFRILQTLKTTGSDDKYRLSDMSTHK